jgi:hypothetical protein
MIDAQRNFYKRERSLRRKHKRMARGYVTKLDKNGVIVQKPDNKVKGFGARMLVLLATCFVVFKAFILANLGSEEYLARLAGLQTGETYQQVGAWLMQIDPVTGFIAQNLQLVMS